MRGLTVLGLMPMLAMLCFTLASCNAPLREKLDLSYKWLFMDKDGHDFHKKDFDDNNWFPPEKVYSKEWSREHIRVPGETVWYRFHFKKPDAAGGWLCYVKEGPVVKRIFFNGHEISQFVAHGLRRGGSYLTRKWIKFGYWWFIPDELWEEENVLAIQLYDIKYLNDNNFGEISLRRSALDERIGITSSISTDGNKEGFLDLSLYNPTPEKTEFNVSWTEQDMFDVSLGGTNVINVKLDSLGETPLRIKVANGNACKILARFEGQDSSFTRPFYVVTPYTETAARKTWRLDGKSNAVSPWRLDDPGKGNALSLWEMANPGQNPIEFPPPDDSKWEKVEAPHVFKAPMKEWQGIWYRRIFEMANILPDKKYYLYFEGVYDDCKVWINGHFAGEHKGADLPFYIDISGHIKPGENVIHVGIAGWPVKLAPGIAVKYGESSIPPRSLVRSLMPSESRGALLGITKSVFLCEMPDIWIKDMLVRTYLDRKMVEPTVRILNTLNQDVSVKLAFSIVDKGAIKATKTVDVCLQKGLNLIPAPFEWSGVKWNPENPHLYEMRCDVIKDGSLKDSKSARFGWREYGISGNKILLNGEEFKAYGSYRGGISGSLHNIYGANECWNYLSSLKGVGFNSSRVPIYVHESFPEIADEIGIVISQEAGFSANHAQAFDYSGDGIYDYVHREIEGKMWERGNSPSIICWNTGNEVYAPWLAPAAKMKALELKVKGTDPTRLVINDSQFDLEGSAEVNNPHYPWYGVLPNDAYWYGYDGSRMPATEKERRLYQFENGEGTFVDMERRGIISGCVNWNRRTPIWIGEFSWRDEGQIPGAYANMYGEDVLTYWPDIECYGSLAGLAQERDYLFTGYRQCGVNAFQAHCWPFTHFETLARQAILLKDRSCQFFSNSKISRTITVHNDSAERGKFAAGFELHDRWGDGKYFSKTFKVALEPYGMAQREINLTAPDVDSRRQMAFKTSLVDLRRNKKVFERSYAWELVPESEFHPQNIPEIWLYDTQKRTSELFEKLGIRYRMLDPENIPDSGVICIGEDSLDDRLDKSSHNLLEKIKKANLRVLFLAQNKYGKLWGQKRDIWFDNIRLTFPKGPAYNSSVYNVCPDHPLVKGIGNSELKWWGDDHLVGCEMMEIPSGLNARPLILSDAQDRGRSLNLCALLEIIVGKGKVYFCQMDIVKKALKVPAARELLCRLLENRPDDSGEFEVGKKAYILHSNGSGMFNRIKELIEADSIKDGDIYPPDTKGMDILWTCDRNDSIRSALKKNKDMLRKDIEGGLDLIVSLLEDSDKEWFEGLIEGKVAFNEMPSSQAAKLTYDPLLRGMTNEQLIWDIQRPIPLDKRTKSELDIFRSVVELETPYCNYPLVFPKGWWKIKIGKGFIFVDQSRWYLHECPKVSRLLTILWTNLGLKMKFDKKVDFTKRMEGCKPFLVNLSGFSNRSYAEAPEKGWKCGINSVQYRDLSAIPKGPVKFNGIPFLIQDDAKSAGKSLISLETEKAGPIPVGRRLDRIFFLHTAGWVQAGKGDTLLKYRIRYDKDYIPPMPPPEETVEIRNGYEIADWWFGNNTPKLLAKNSEIAWTWSERALKKDIGICMTEWVNPEPQTKIKHIEIEASGSGQKVVLAITGLVKSSDQISEE